MAESVLDYWKKKHMVDKKMTAKELGDMSTFQSTGFYDFDRLSA